MKQNLKSLASIRSGYQFRGGLKDENPDEAPVRVIQIKDVSAGDIAFDEVDSLRPSKDVSKDAIERGDVLLLGRGRRFFAASVEVPVEELTIAVHSFWILRPHPLQPHSESVLPAYLAWFLNHPETQATLSSHSNQTQIPFISRAIVEEIQIEVPPLETQTQIARLDQLNRREQQLAQQLSETRAKWMDALTLQLACAQITPKP